LAEGRDTVGTRVVSSQDARWGEGHAWTVSSDPVLSIGDVDGPEATQLVAVAAAARRSDGDIVVVDRGARAVRLYDSGGRFVKTFGSGGAGPGEFLDPSSVSIGTGDTVAVWDGQLFRVTRFDESGGVADVRTLDMAEMAKAVEPPLYPGSVELLGNGDFLVRLIEKSGKLSPSGRVRPRSGALRVSGDLSSIDTLMFFGDTAKTIVEAPFGRYPIAPPLALGPVITHQGNPPRICIGDRSGPEVLCLDPAGGRVLLRWESAPAPVTDEEVREWREANLRLFGEKLREEDILRMLDQVPVPSVRPDFSELTLDEEWNLWVRLGPTVGSEGTSVDHLVFDPNGALLGTVALPPIRILEIGADFVMGVYRDELEVEHLALYEFRKPSSTAE
jgi:hypothetical protein